VKSETLKKLKEDKMAKNAALFHEKAIIEFYGEDLTAEEPGSHNDGS